MSRAIEGMAQRHSNKQYTQKARRFRRRSASVNWISIDDDNASAVLYPGRHLPAKFARPQKLSCKPQPCRPIFGAYPKTKMTRISTGIPYFSHRRAHDGKRTPRPALASAWKPSQPQPLRVVQNSTKNSAPKGSRLFDTMKSSIDWMSPTAGTVTPERTLNPSAHGSDSTSTRTPVIAAARRR